MSPAPESAPPLSPDAYSELLQAERGPFALELGDTVWRALGGFLSELDAWRRRINLTGALSPRDLALHCLESLLGSRLIYDGERVLDVGSGAGFPAVPIAMARPDLAMTLVEPRAKKVAFLRHVARTFGAAGVEVLESRIEEVGGQTFGAVTTRALAGIADWSARPGLLRPGGLLLCWTTRAAALSTELAGVFSREEPLPIPGSARRQIAVFRRV